MSEEKTIRRLFKLISGDVILGEVVLVETANGQEIQIKTPFTAKGGNIMPYMYDVMAQAPSAVQIHPMNILWSVPLDEFEEANKVYIQATTGIITDVKPELIKGL